MNTSKVAVCIAAYNRADLIKETFDGLALQTLKDFHIYLCYDGSTDNIKEVAENYTLPITLCEYGATPSAGGSKNKAVSLALQNSHKYIQMVDSDDIPFPTMLEENSNRMDKGDIDWVLCWGRTFGASSYSLRASIKSFEEQSNRNYLHSWIMAKTDVFRKQNYRHNEVGADDWDLWVRITKDGYKGAILEKELYGYRIHRNRVTQTIMDTLTFEDVRNKIREMNNLER